MLNDEEKEYLKMIYKGRKCEEIAQMINEKFGANHNAKEIESFKGRNRLRSDVDCTFKKGQVSYNKGKKWNEYLTKEKQEKIRETCFKNGNIPKNHKVVGKERVIEGKVQIKIAEPNVWEYKHRVIYKQYYGEIPDGMNVIFADGNKFNFELDNLLLVTDKELLKMNQNHLIKEDKDLTKSGLALTKLMNKIYEKKK